MKSEKKTRKWNWRRGLLKIVLSVVSFFTLGLPILAYWTIKYAVSEAIEESNDK